MADKHAFAPGTIFCRCAHVRDGHCRGLCRNFFLVCKRPNAEARPCCRSASSQTGCVRTSSTGGSPSKRMLQGRDRPWKLRSNCCDHRWPCDACGRTGSTGASDSPTLHAAGQR
jgi:hypothetical protein